MIRAGRVDRGRGTRYTARVRTGGPVPRGPGRFAAAGRSGLGTRPQEPGKRRGRRPPAAAWLLLACLAAAGCGGDAPPPAADGTAPVDGGTAVIAFPADPDVLNPLLYTSAHAGQVLDLLGDALVEMDEDFVYRPRIAARLDFAPDSLSVTVRLRPWRWSDGEPLTAHDVAATCRLFADPRVASPRGGGRFLNVVAVTALDDSTVRYEFRESRNDLVATLGHFLLPAHVTDHLDPAAVRAWPLNERPLSSGPFVLESWERNQSLVLRRNESYPGTRPRLERLVLRIIPDETSRLVEVETGGADLLEDVPVHALARLRGRDDLVVHRLQGRLVGQIVWNLADPRFADARVRRALSLAIDRSFFVDGLLEGCALPGGGPLPPALWAFDRDLPPESYDPQRARDLLDEAGWRDADGDGVRERDGRVLSFTLLTRKGDAVRENGAVAVRDHLGRVGVACRPRVMEMGAAVDLVQSGRFDAYLGVYSERLAVDPSPRFASGSWSLFNYGHYASDAADSLLALGLAERDRARAKPVWDAFQRLIMADAPVATLYYPDQVVAVSRRLRGVSPHVLSTYQNVQDWWIAPADRR